MKKNLSIFLALVFFGTLLAFGVLYTQQNSKAQVEQKRVDYKGAPITDTDMDGLTNEGELQIYGTDPSKPDTDGDGWSDGVEVLSGTDPLDAKSFPGVLLPKEEVGASVQGETPWAWYISRSGGIIAFLLLYVSIFLGLTIRIPWLRNFFAPLYSLQGHCWIALQSIIFALLHGLILMLDKYIHFSFLDIFVPYSSHFKPEFVALGSIGLYLMVILTITSYARQYLSQKMWRTLHFFNIGLYAIVFIHALYLGTDLQSGIVRNIFIGANILLVILFVTNFILRIKDAIGKRSQKQEEATFEQ